MSNAEYGKKYYLKVTKKKRQKQAKLRSKAKAKLRKELIDSPRAVEHVCPICGTVWIEQSSAVYPKLNKMCDICRKQKRNEYERSDKGKLRKRNYNKKKYHTDENFRQMFLKNNKTYYERKKQSTVDNEN